MAFGNGIVCGNFANVDQPLVVDGGINQYAQGVVGLLGEMHGKAFTKQPPSKDGGFGLRAESPDTHRLNDASHYGSTLKLSC